MGHSEQCRKRKEEELEKVGDNRFEREKARLFENMEEGQNKSKRRKGEEESKKPKPGKRSNVIQRIDGDFKRFDAAPKSGRSADAAQTRGGLPMSAGH